MKSESVTTEQTLRFALDEAIKRSDMNMEMANIAEAKYQKVAKALKIYVDGFPTEDALYKHRSECEKLLGMKL